jgi:ribonuclease J
VLSTRDLRVHSPLRILPLGGLGEIGMNCMAIETPEGILIVDCGVMFPDREGLGVDVIHPDFTWLRDRQERVAGVVITHGHEDHIGALPYLLQDLRVPVYGPAYALKLAEERLREHELAVHDLLRPTTPRTPYRAGPFEVEPIRACTRATS